MKKVVTPTLIRLLMPLTQRALVAASVCLAFASPAAHAQLGSVICGDLRAEGQVGPYDYRTIPSQPKYLVESAHFTSRVANLVSGSTGSIGGDLDYTLRAIPNHPRALLAMTRLTKRLKTAQIPGARFTAVCYFDRAMRMAPDDPMPHVLFASYLSTNQKTAEAKRELDEAESLRGTPRGFDLDYNLGLLYLDLGEYDKAAVAARRAYALGAPLPALRTKLKAKGRSIE